MHFAAVGFLYLLLLLPLLAALLVYGQLQRRAGLVRLAGPRAAAELAGPGAATVRQWLADCSVVAAATLTVLALSQPQWGQPRQPPPRPGRDVLVAIDVSRSMLAEDVVPNRLERAKAIAQDLVTALQARPGYRLGLIAFAGSASLKCPLTSVGSYLSLALERLTTNSVPRGGTRLAEAILEALQDYDDKTDNARDLVLITDGEDQGSNWQAAAAEARRLGVAIHTVGLGDPAAGAHIPLAVADGRRQFLAYRGRLVRSRLREAPLRRLANTTGGLFVPARNRAVDLGQLFGQVIEPIRGPAPVGQRGRHRFQWFLAAAVMMLCLEALLSRRCRRVGPAVDNHSAPAVAGQSGPGLSGAGRATVAMILAASLAITAAAPRADRAADLVAEGNRLYAQARYVQAADRFRRAAELAPDSAVALFNWATAVFQTGDYAAAARLYSRARERAGLSLRPAIDYGLGNSHLLMARRQRQRPEVAAQQARQAIQSYRSAIALSSAVGRDLSIVLQARHNLELAKRLLDELRPARRQRSGQPAGSGGPSRTGRGGPAAAGSSTAADEPSRSRPPDDLTGHVTKVQAGGGLQKGQNRTGQSDLAGPISAEQAAARLRLALQRIRAAKRRQTAAAAQPPAQTTTEKDW